MVPRSGFSQKYDHSLRPRSKQGQTIFRHEPGLRETDGAVFGPTIDSKNGESESQRAILECRAKKAGPKNKSQKRARTLQPKKKIHKKGRAPSSPKTSHKKRSPDLLAPKFSKQLLNRQKSNQTVSQQLTKHYQTVTFPGRTFLQIGNGHGLLDCVCASDVVCASACSSSPQLFGLKSMPGPSSPMAFVNGFGVL